MTEADEAQPLRRRLAREIRARPERSAAAEVAIGVLSGLAAVAVRLALPLEPEQLPTLPVVVALAIVTTFVGVRAGVATAIVGGLLSWYFFFNAYSWSLGNEAWIPLAGFVVIATVIITTAQLYRASARSSHEMEVARLQAQADQAQFFAREMAHRLKNALAIVQAIAFQTIGAESEDAAKFAGRLKALSNANELLNEHVERPAAKIHEVVEAALEPFSEFRSRFDVESVDATISAQEVVSLSLALHELTTNAIKYGALSTATGRVIISVERSGDDLTLRWQEQGGPSVGEPDSGGFGTRLLGRASMKTDLDFAEDGVRCSMRLRAID